MFTTQEETKFLPDKFYSWIKCNRNFNGFYVTSYSSDSSTLSMWQRFASILKTHPTVSSMKA